MKIINQHLGLPVISLDTSERAGDVVRFITDQVSGRIVAVAVSRRWYQEPHGVLFSDCRAFGQNVILISRVDALRPLSQMEEVSVHLEASNDARQRTAITEGGRLLGSVTDEAFDEETGEVTGYRLDVIAETGTSRTVYIPHSTFVTSSATVAILQEDVLDHAAETLEGVGSRESGVGAEPEAGGQGPKPELEPARQQPAPQEPAPQPPPAAAPQEAAGQGAWEGSEDVAYATPAEVVAPPAEASLTTPEQPAPPAADEDEAIFDDITPGDEDLMAEAEDFAPTTPDYEPVAEDAVADEPVVVESTPTATAPPPSPAAALQGHDRIMMALSLGQVARTAVRDPAGNVLVEAGETITADTTQAAARAGADTLYALWTATQEPTPES